MALQGQACHDEQDKNIIEMTGVDGSFMKDDNEIDLTADTGKIDRKAQTVYVEGNVKGKSKDGLVLYAKNLTYDGKTQILPRINSSQRKKTTAY